ncbi:MAG: hypothetical protein ABI606_04550, partial [Rhodoferax sp.]
VMQLDSMTQQNAALVEETSAAAGSLQDQARQLADVAGSFKLDGGLAHTPRATPRPAVTRAPAPKALKPAPRPTQIAARKPMASRPAPPAAAMPRLASTPAPASKASGNDE